MARTLFSLMLDEAVVREVDALAHRLGTNRSNLINTILAERVGFVTPEQQMRSVLSAIDRLMQPSRELIPFFAPNARSVSLKSALDYKYRPTVKYEVALTGGDTERIGVLSVLFRTRSAALLDAMADFFRYWAKLETALLPPETRPEMTLEDGRFTRTLSCPEPDCGAETLAEAITDYIKLFDRCLKAYLSGNADAEDLQAVYRQYLAKNQTTV